MPKAKCPEGSRDRSNFSGSSHRRGSRFAAPKHIMTRDSAGMVWPSKLMSSEVSRNICWTGDSQRRASSKATRLRPGLLRSADDVVAELLRVGLWHGVNPSSLVGQQAR